MPGDYVQRTHGLSKRSGEPLSPRTKAGYLTATRTVFRDFQEWEWMPRRFDPTTALATPRSVLALVGPNPRVIADDVWAKLLWAGLNIEPDDLPTAASGPCYPIELVRAITLVWLFAGQRSDEIARLRLGCIRWQHDGMPIPGDSDEVLAQDAVCLLDIPTHKTGTAFTKPVDPLVARRSKLGRRSGPISRRCWTARRVSTPTFDSRFAPATSARPPSTPRSFRHCAGRPVSRPRTFAATSPATGRDPRLPASSTTPRNR